METPASIYRGIPTHSPLVSCIVLHLSPGGTGIGFSGMHPVKQMDPRNNNQNNC